MLVGKTFDMKYNKFDDIRVIPSHAISMAWNLFLLVAIVLWPTDSFAQSTFGTLICNIQANGLGGYPFILSAAAYVMGAFLLLRSGLLFKRYADNPAQGTLATPIAHAISAGFLMALPAFAGVLVTSIFSGGQAPGGTTACAPGSVSQVSSGASLDVMMTNFVGNIHKPVFFLVSVIAFIVGGTFIVQGLLRAAKSGADPRAADPKVVISNLVFGAILMAFATTLPSMLGTLFGDETISNMTNTTSIIQWSKITGSSGSNDVADKAIKAVLAFIQIVGVIAFFRGWLLLKKAVEGGQATIAQGLTHIIAGAMCVNMDKMLAIIDETFGTGIVG